MAAGAATHAPKILCTKIIGISGYFFSQSNRSVRHVRSSHRERELRAASELLWVCVPT